MKSAGLLPKARTRYYADACIFKQLECIENISTLSQGLCLLNSFLWKLKLQQRSKILQNEGFGARKMQVKRMESYSFGK
jgi:hypothetical protein